VTLAPGSTFGPYKILEPLGRGGMASVFKAYEPGLDRYVALKVLPAQSVQDEASAERFRREAKVIARLEHPNITPIHNFGIDQASQIPWMAMRLISGGTLSSRLTMRMTPQRAVAILRGVADALDYAHGKGVMHRDVKPANILLDEAGRVYLADFGIARLVEGATALTAAGLISGTPAYMAPEQATGLTLDHRVDIYALGVVAYEVLAGKVPFAAENPIDVLMKHVQSSVPVIPDLPAPVMEALLKALAKKPQDRWESAGALVSALESTIAQMPVVGASPTAPGMAPIPMTDAGMVVSPPTTRPPAAPTSAYSTAPPPPPPPAALNDATIVTPPRRGPAEPPPGAGGPGTGAMIGGALALVTLLVAGGLYLYLRDPAPTETAATSGPAAAGQPGSTVAPAAGIPRDPTVPATVPPRAETVERESMDTPPSTVAVRVPAPPPTLPPTTTGPAAVSMATAPVTTAAAAPAPPPAAGTLRLDVNAVQPAFGDMAALLSIDVSVDGHPLRSVSLRFDGATPFARSRRRQAFDIPGLPVGQRTVSVVVRADRGLDPVQAATQIAVAEGTQSATLDVRLRGNGDGDANFR
jgi:tRNA A-37 threonylcarbamoyl transferase component Bud32